MSGDARLTAWLPDGSGQYQRVLTDGNGRVQVAAGAGTPGAPAGGVQSVQGVAGGTPVPAVLQNKQGLVVGAPAFIAIGLELSGYAAPTDLYSLVNPAGSGKVIQCRSFVIGCQATTGTLSKFRWFKRNILNTGGAPSSITPTPFDSNDTPVGILRAYSSAPSIDASGLLIGYQQASSTATTAAPAAINIGTNTSQPVNLGIDMAVPITLRPGQELAFNFNGVTLPLGSVFTPFVEWTEQ